jgi:hypothetical protein
MNREKKAEETTGVDRRGFLAKTLEVIPKPVDK